MVKELTKEEFNAYLKAYKQKTPNIDKVVAWFITRGIQLSVLLVIAVIIKWAVLKLI